MGVVLPAKLFTMSAGWVGKGAQVKESLLGAGTGRHRGKGCRPVNTYTEDGNNGRSLNARKVEIMSSEIFTPKKDGEEYPTRRAKCSARRQPGAAAWVVGWRLAIFAANAVACVRVCVCRCLCRRRARRGSFTPALRRRAHHAAHARWNGVTACRHAPVRTLLSVSVVPDIVIKNHCYILLFFSAFHHLFTQQFGASSCCRFEDVTPSSSSV